MNRKRSAVLGALALAAPLVSVVSAPATAAPAQFCQENCYNSGYRYVLDKTASLRDLGLAFEFGEAAEYYCSGPRGDRELIDSLDADQATASILAASRFVSDGSIDLRILTDNRGRPVGIGFELPALPASQGAALRSAAATGLGGPSIDDLIGLQFQLVCFDDRGAVSGEQI